MQWPFFPAGNQEKQNNKKSSRLNTNFYTGNPPDFHQIEIALEDKLMSGSLGERDEKHSWLELKA